jgi:hypothetical protein
MKGEARSSFLERDRVGMEVAMDLLGLPGIIESHDDLMVSYSQG